MRRYPLILLTLVTLGAASEPSAFEAGDLSRDNPYGLTQTEQYILGNKEELNELKNRIIHLETSLEELSGGLDAFRSLTAGGNEKLFKLARQLGGIQSSISLQEEYQKKIDTDISNLNSKISTFEQNQSRINKETHEMDDNLKTALKELSTLIDNINNSYVHKEEMKRALKKLVDELGGSHSAAPVGQKSFEARKSSDILEESKALYKKKKFDQALGGLEYLAQQRDYKKAEVMYVLGEIFYQTAKYNKAITAFKESVKLDDKAKYMHVLLFHTGISYAKLGKNKEAKKFYESLISLYPDSYLVGSAKKRLKGL